LCNSPSQGHHLTHLPLSKMTLAARLIQPAQF
jgi:hypothetical protein